jgi:hypothetical protein
MEKGILILLGTFIVVAIIHVVSMKMTKISETKKSSFRKVFFYIYGVFLTLSGILQCIEKNEIRFFFFNTVFMWLGILNFKFHRKDATKNELNLIMNLAVFSLIPQG